MKFAAHFIKIRGRKKGKSLCFSFPQNAQKNAELCLLVLDSAKLCEISGIKKVSKKF
jgi:hypothetical protein